MQRSVLLTKPVSLAPGNGRRSIEASRLHLVQSGCDFDAAAAVCAVACLLHGVRQAAIVVLNG